MVSLPLDIVDVLCKQGKGKTQCRYLGHEQTNNLWVCCKNLSDKRQIINEEVNKMFNKIKGSPKEDDMPTGDNCSGYSIIEPTI